MLRCAWVGSHLEGLPAFAALLDAGSEIVAAFTLTAEAAARRSGTAYYEPVCRRFGVPLHRIGIADAFAESGSREYLFDRYRLGVPHIVEAAWTALGRRDPLPAIPRVPSTPGTYAPV